MYSLIRDKITYDNINNIITLERPYRFRTSFYLGNYICKNSIIPRRSALLFLTEHTYFYSELSSNNEFFNSRFELNYNKRRFYKWEVRYLHHT